MKQELLIKSLLQCGYCAKPQAWHAYPRSIMTNNDRVEFSTSGVGRMA